ncbi:hypothetical protein SLEP1_g48575 [Rubroshorea leprosula]|uniref:Uncharacterized protein n=1 Tax=Rubroshorea leprosula TaxID=152421 RepID=A0AAV5LX27_9ROSI|nr:hypothetical protein SLEP1_g48575 [Rubroshorea leprosula]
MSTVNSVGFEVSLGFVPDEEELLILALLLEPGVFLLGHDEFSEFSMRYWWIEKNSAARWAPNVNTKK